MEVIDVVDQSMLKDNIVFNHILPQNGLYVIPDVIQINVQDVSTIGSALYGEPQSIYYLTVISVDVNTSESRLKAGATKISG